MPLWGTSTDADNQPKWLGGVNAEGASGRKTDCFAAPGGWAMRAGQANSGNDNTSAQVEILAALSGGHASGLSGVMGEANLLSVGWVTNTSLAHDGTGRLDIYFNCDEALTVTSAAWSADAGDYETNQWYFIMDILGPTDMVSDANIVMQYYAGSGTNRITFRGVIPAAAVSGARFAFNATGATSRDCQMTTHGTAAVVDGNGTTCTWADQKLFGSSAGAGVDHSSAVWGTGVAQYNSELVETQTLETVAGSSSGSSATVLTSLACV
tara:strand:+ start:61 stop:861 length:801 start_codon:yes stop_codon:yes gene_type:complete